MKRRTQIILLLPIFSLCAGLLPGLAGCAKRGPEDHRLTIVAAENFYASVAQEIAVDSVKVISILNNPNQDPHEFTANAETAKDVADADIVIYNGLGYDEWMKKLLDVNSRAGQIVICAADLIGAPAGSNPHICNDPRTMPALAVRLSQILKQPEELVKFDSEMNIVRAKISEIKSKYAGVPVTATEPVFDYMISALGFTNENMAFQLAVMNGTEPSFQATADFEKSLRSRAVRVLLYNKQVTSPASERMRVIAQQNGIPIVGVTETQPPEAKSYADWMLSELNQIEGALKANS